jgi:hypothetical protein
VVGEAKVQELKRFVCPKTIANQYSWFTVGQLFSLGIKNAREPLQADLGVIIPVFRKSIMPIQGLGRWSGCFDGSKLARSLAGEMTYRQR